ncbi:MAG: PD-(D/E)XK nuclease family protein [Chitinophagales bacterium]|nr:PD-(D/E)XK nuclease family protein [Chitinophagales bacterium]
MNFLQNIADFVYQHSVNMNTASILMLFPNKRAIGVFETYLMQCFENTAYVSPHCITIEDFFHQQANYAIADEITQLNILFQLHQKVSNSTQDFYEFLPWGKLILRDFNEIDKYLVKTNSLFSDIIDFKQLEETLPLDDIAKEYLELFSNAIQVDTKAPLNTQFLKTWKILGQLYNAFNNVLSQQSLTYSGQCFRQLITQLKQSNTSIPYSVIHFCGFNAFTTAEETLLDLLKLKQTVYTWWDIDDSFMQSKIHEAGNFLRLYYKKYNDEKLDFWINDNNKQAQQIYIQNIASNVGQVHYALEEASKQTSSTAIVLCDEMLLDVVLPSIDYNLCNITMGYAIKLSVSYSLLSSIIELVQQANKDGNTISIPSKNIIQLFNHKESNFIWKAAIPFQSLPNYVSIDFFNRFVYDDFALNLNLFYNGIDLGNYLIKLLESITINEAPIIQSLKEQILYINNLVSQQDYLQSIDNYSMLLIEQLQQISIPFTTSKDAKIQIMGFLETRLLDFDNIYIISMNDDKLPGTNKNNSFIPYHLRKAFGMPTFEQFDGINAYHFYRILKRSQHAHLIYNSAVSDNMSEESRFIRQIKIENSNKNNLHLINIDINSDNNKRNESIEIKKTPAIIEQLAKIEFSATAIQQYLNSPIDFYFSYILKLRVPEDKQFEIDAASFGTLLHNTLEYYYNQTENISVDDALQVILEQEKITVSDLSGDHQLQIEVIKNICSKVIEKDKLEQFTIISNEAKLRTENFVLNNGTSICLKGKVDRIDALDNNIIRIIDYKTGNETLRAFPKMSKDEEKTKASFDSFFEAIFSKTNNSYKATLQGLLYAYLYKQKNPSASVVVGFYLAKSLNNGLHYLNNGAVISNEFLDLFEQHLKTLFDEIFDINIPFTLGKNEKYQSYSEYSLLVE